MTPTLRRPRFGFGMSAIATMPTRAAPSVPGPPEIGGGVYYTTVPLDDDWIAVYYLARQGRNLVVAEARIMPTAKLYVEEEQTSVRTTYDAATDREVRGAPRTTRAWVMLPDMLRALPYWSGARAGIDTEVPPGGLSSRLVRSTVRIGEALRESQTRLRWFRDEATGTARSLLAAMRVDPLVADDVNLGRKGPGRKPLTNEALLPVAVAYDRAVRRGSRRAIKDVAAALGWDQGKVRAYVFRARGRGLLERATKTVAHGGLTAAGRVLAARQQQTRRATPRRRGRR
jgi:hypothetical protein